MTNCFYLDMDGVVADWDTAAEQFLNIAARPEPIKGTNYRLTRSEYDEIKKIPHFYRDLPKMQSADLLVNLARQYRDVLGWELKFLTAIPHHNDVPWAFWDKMLWAQHHYPDIPVMFGPYSSDKKSHCSPGDILVDDRWDNCDSWRSAGGLAFRVQGRTLVPVLDLLTLDLQARLGNSVK